MVFSPFDERPRDLTRRTRDAADRAPSIAFQPLDRTWRSNFVRCRRAARNIDEQPPISPTKSLPNVYSFVRRASCGRLVVSAARVVAEPSPSLTPRVFPVHRRWHAVRISRRTSSWTFSSPRFTAKSRRRMPSSRSRGVSRRRRLCQQPRRQ